MWFHLHEAERRVLTVSVALALLGFGLDAALRRYPALNRTIHFIDSPASFTKIDLNSAGRRELESLPYIGPYTAEKILEYRGRHGRFRFVDEIRKIPGVRMDNFRHFRDHLEVRP